MQTTFTYGSHSIVCGHTEPTIEEPEDHQLGRWSMVAIAVHAEHTPLFVEHLVEGKSDMLTFRFNHLVRYGKARVFRVQPTVGDTYEVEFVGTGALWSM